MTDSQPRNSELRINEQDREAIKEAKKEFPAFDSSTALGFVARYACLELVESDSNADDSGVTL